MYLQYVFLACVICALSDGFSLPKKPTVNIFYETLDQKSINFFTNNFDSYYTKLRDFVDVHFVPFGKAELTKSGTGVPKITCENGDTECYGNKVHACALKLLQTTETKVEFVVCTMNHTNPKTVTMETYPTKKCVDQVEVPELTMANLESCIAKDSMTLLEKYANETKYTITSLPIITLNSDPFDLPLSSDLVNDFQGTLCQKFASVPGISAVCKNDTTPTTSSPHLTTSHPNSATIIPTSYWPLFVAITLTLLFEVKIFF